MIRPADASGEEIASYWSGWARVWDATLRLSRLKTRYRRDAISALRLARGETVLDVACGTGLNFPYLYEGVGSSGRIIAIDVAPEMLERAKTRAREKGFENVTFIPGDVSAVELPPVHAAAACWCMVAIPDYRGALENVVKSLCPDGRIAILDLKPMRGFPGPLLNPIWKWGFCVTRQDLGCEPWNDLEELVGDVRVREWKYGSMLGSVYAAWGKRTTGPDQE